MAESTARALVLIARPTPSGVDQRSLARLATEVADRVPNPVWTAQLDQQDPSVPAVLDELVAEGATEILCVPLAVPADRYLRTWIGRAVAHWRAGAVVVPEIRIAPELSGLAADTVAALADTAGDSVTASPAGFTSPAWSVLEVPPRHLFVCRGPRCLVYGAGATHRALTAATKGTGTQVTPCGCLGPCNLGPLVVEGSTWHTGVGTVQAAGICSKDPAGAMSHSSVGYSR